MVLEADRAGCADEVVVIAAALSIQDPRIRPAEKRAEADEQHARFVDQDARSDFLAFLNLWRHLRAQQKELLAQRLSQDVPRRVPALHARARVAGSRRASCARRRATSA